MKRSAKILTLAIALFAGFGTSAAHAEGFKVGADVVSSYVWRGTDYGDSPAIQPALSYTFKNGISVGAWGSYAVTENNGNDRYKEVDLTVSLPVGPFTFAVTDYNNNPEGAKAFDFSNDSSNVVEISTAYAAGNLSLLAAINVAGLEGTAKHAKYCEAGYKFYEKDGYTAKLVAGLGDEDYYGDANGDNVALVNTGVSVSKDRFTGSFVYNPDTEKSYLVFMASF
jgi:hypothetical protein